MSEFRFFAYTDFEYRTNQTQNLLNLPIAPFHPTRLTTTDEISHELNVPYTVFEILVAIFAVIGNLMVIIVFQRDRKLRRRTNYYIVSLAMADFLVGSLGVPFAILASIGMPTNLYACLFTVSLLVVLCTISIFCLVAVSVDRYWAILYPMAYSRNVRTKTAIFIISMCWLAGTVVGFLPLFGWHADVGPNQACLFVEVMDYNYLVFLYFATIITPALIMLAFYAHIYRVIVKQIRQIVTMNPLGDCSRRSSTAQIHQTTPSRGCHGGTMLRVLGAARKRDVKATQNLSIIVVFFMICWIPLYTINCIKAFCPSCNVHPKLTLFCIILSHLNSAVNPVLYAYHLKDFRAALKNLILKIMGIEVEPQIDAMHRFSVASQHRLQSMDASVRMGSMHPRIYVDSPIWLRQQQQPLKQVPKCGIVSPCLTNSIGSIHQTVAAVASVPSDIQREMWNIMEASSGAEIADAHYEFPSTSSANNDDVDNNDESPKSQKSPASPKTNAKLQHCVAGYESPYSYDNQNYSSSADDDPEYDEVFLEPALANGCGAVDAHELNKSLIACAMREKLRADDYDIGDYQLNESPIAQKSTPQKHLPSVAAATATPRLARSESLSRSSSSNICRVNSSVFVITDTTTSNQAARKFQKSPRLVKTHLTSRTCASDSSSPTRDDLVTLSPQAVRLLTQSNSSNSSSSHSVGGGTSAAANNSKQKNHNNNSNATNNLNYYTIQCHPSHLHRYQRQQSQQHHYHHPEKFSPLKAMTDFIFPPIVKHSSLFQIFQPSSAAATGTTGAASATTKTVVLPPQPAPQSVENSFAEESTSTATTEVAASDTAVVSAVAAIDS